MKDIAQKLNISVVSVSKAINNQDGVSDELRERVLDEAYRLGYISQRREPAERIQKFAYITSKRFMTEGELFFTQIFYYLSELCNEGGYTLSLFAVGKEEEGKLMISPSINSANVDGVFLGGELSEQYVHSLRNLDLPMVCIDFYKSEIESDCIIVDNFYAGYRTTTYLLNNGHTRVGYVGHPIVDASLLDRFFGYRKALFQRGCEYREDWHLTFSEDTVLPSELPTAFVCDNDATAIPFMKLLIEKGYGVPQDVSIVSFDNLETSKNQRPSLTTVDINRALFAEKALERMLERMANRKAPYQRVLLDARLVVRESVRDLTRNEG